MLQRFKVSVWRRKGKLRCMESKASEEVLVIMKMERKSQEEIR
jgi:hypothetical protein